MTETEAIALLMLHRDHHMAEINAILDILRNAGLTDDEILAELIGELKKRGEL